MYIKFFTLKMYVQVLFKTVIFSVYHRKTKITLIRQFLHIFGTHSSCLQWWFIVFTLIFVEFLIYSCLLYTSDAADE